MILGQISIKQSALVNVRPAAEYAAGHIPGAIHLLPDYPQLVISKRCVDQANLEQQCLYLT